MKNITSNVYMAIIIIVTYVSEPIIDMRAKYNAAEKMDGDMAAKI